MSTIQQRRQRHDDAAQTSTQSDTSHTMHGQLTHRSQLLDVFDMLFPRDDNIVYAFAYGSGVFDQQLVSSASDNQIQDEKSHPPQKKQYPPDNASSSSPPMLDLILVVEDSLAFHHANLTRNRHHYSSFCRAVGPIGCSHLQRSYGGGVFFVNTTITDNSDANLPIEHRRLKYGVIQDSDLQSDLMDWKYLYIAGRMQKPTLPMMISHAEKNDNVFVPQHLLDAQQTNLQSALVTACCFLLSNDTYRQQDDPAFADSKLRALPSTTSSSTTSLLIPWQALFEQICALSYSGDFRMSIGAEDPRKIQRLVHGPGQLQRFQTLYQEPIQSLQDQGLLQMSTNGVVLPMDMLTSRLYRNVPEPFWNLLPKTLQHQAEKHSSLSRALQSIVAPAARGQTIKGLVTAGLGASIRYATAKFAKGMKR